jgi:hypothetical protein
MTLGIGQSMMITDSDVRRIALSMPEAEERAHVGRPDFRVRNKIFATIRSSNNRTVVKLSVPDQSALVAMDSDTFSVNSWSHPGWTNVHMKLVTKAQFRTVVQSAWRNVAPKKLAASCAANAGNSERPNKPFKPIARENARSGLRRRWAAGRRTKCRTFV